MLARNISCVILLVVLTASQTWSQHLDSLIALRDTTLISGEQIDLQLQIAYELSDTDIREALDRANRALREAEEIASVRWTAEAKLAIGRFYDYMGVNKEAADLLIEAFKSFVELGDSLKQANTLMHIGNTYFYIDLYIFSYSKKNMVKKLYNKDEVISLKKRILILHNILNLKYNNGF